MKPGHLAALLELQKKIGFDAEEVERRVQLALDREHWRTLSPFASVETGAFAAEALIPDQTIVERESARFINDGYFELGSLLGPPTTSVCYRIVESLRAAGWPAVFGFMYDEFWNVTRGGVIHSFLTRILGEGYKQTTRVWSHYVPGMEGAAGWFPHVDVTSEKHRGGLSVWIPLSDATLTNGCMFVVPRRHCSSEALRAFEKGEPLDTHSYRMLMHGATPLPASAGSVLGWAHDVVHWGGINRGDPNARINLAIDFYGPTAVPEEDAFPLLSPECPLPSFELRLYSIARAFGMYGSRWLELARYREVATRLADLTREAATRPLG